MQTSFISLLEIPGSSANDAQWEMPSLFRCASEGSQQSEGNFKLWGITILRTSSAPWEKHLRGFSFAHSPEFSPSGGTAESWNDTGSLSSALSGLRVLHLPASQLGWILGSIPNWTVSSQPMNDHTSMDSGNSLLPLPLLHIYSRRFIMMHNCLSLYCSSPQIS